MNVVELIVEKTEELPIKIAVVFVVTAFVAAPILIADVFNTAAVPT